MIKNNNKDSNNNINKDNNNANNNKNNDNNDKIKIIIQRKLIAELIQLWVINSLFK